MNRTALSSNGKQYLVAVDRQTDINRIVKDIEADPSAVDSNEITGAGGGGQPEETHCVTRKRKGE